MKVDPKFCEKRKCKYNNLADINVVCSFKCDRDCDIGVSNCESCEYVDDLPTGCPWYMEQIMERQTK